MSFSETIFLFFLALIIFGPKKLPEIARQAGRLLAELRRASNEFRSQIETEIAHIEVEKKAQAILPPSSPPPGAVATLSLNPPPGEAVPEPSSATL
ncbi:MAG: twin-arginine translocase TatA/TatE family subunit, partial [Candidatus Sulfotelmatobacter sp.]